MVRWERPAEGRFTRFAAEMVDPWWTGRPTSFWQIVVASLDLFSEQIAHRVGSTEWLHEG